MNFNIYYTDIYICKLMVGVRLYVYMTKVGRAISNEKLRIYCY